MYCWQMNRLKALSSSSRPTWSGLGLGLGLGFGFGVGSG